MNESAGLLHRNRRLGLLLKNIFGVVDGARMFCTDYTDAIPQNSFHEGYKCNAKVTKIFMFNFKGEAIFCGLNFPGSWHDSRLDWMSGLHCPCLEELIPLAMHCCLIVDSLSLRTRLFVSEKETKPTERERVSCWGQVITSCTSCCQVKEKQRSGKWDHSNLYLGDFAVHFRTIALRSVGCWRSVCTCPACVCNELGSTKSELCMPILIATVHRGCCRC